MIRQTLMFFALAPLAALAQSEENFDLRELDREYRCSDRFSDNPSAYVTIKIYDLSPNDINWLIKKNLDRVGGMLSDQQVSEFSRSLATYKLADVIISEAKFGGIAYQDGLDYRVDFGPDYRLDSPESPIEYTLVIQADGDAYFYDFSVADADESVAPDRQLICSRTQK